jgi:hypothetical protein
VALNAIQSFCHQVALNAIQYGYQYRCFWGGNVVLIFPKCPNTVKPV